MAYRGMHLGFTVVLFLAAACGSSKGSPEASSDAATDGPRKDAGTRPVHDASHPTDGDQSLDAADAHLKGDGGAPLADSGHDAGIAVPLLAYASGYGPDLNVFAVDASSGALVTTSSLPSFGTAPSFLAINRSVTHLYAVDENTPGRVGAYSIAAPSGALTFQNAVSSGGDGPPFVALDWSESFALVANYTSGIVSVLPILASGELGAATTSLMVGVYSHMFVTDLGNRFAFVPCKGSDYIAQFLFDATTGALTPNAVPHVMTASGAGPRHLAFHPNGKFVYLINETSSTMSLYSLDNTAGTLTEVQTVPTIPASFSGTNTAAEVWVHPSAKWLLGSNRGDDSIVVFALDPTTGKMSAPTFTSAGGMTPRDFTIDPTGTRVYVANQTTGNVVPFSFDPETGTLTPTAAPVSVMGASFVGVVAAPH